MSKVNAAAKAAAEAKSAAEKGGAEAQFRYAEMLRDGRGVEKNMKEAVKWYRRAAEQECESALKALREITGGR